MTIASFVISCLAFVVAGIAAWYARRQAHAAEQSADEAKRSADAAAAMASIEEERRADEVAEAERHRVRFKLEHQNAQAYLLRNAGTDCAYAVHVETGEMPARGEVDFAEFPAGDAHKYVFMKSWGGPDHIVVTWHMQADRSDAQRSVKLYLGQ
ncbi:hypothetical protein KIPE111705_05800 [Kibdelosporangium persicum]|uniref:hypothetical protein n=1 Tax=Kibdelosporangium persicum TaxID=2698649 RepID=UPI001565B66F|nr:hypothetical protein [Kibdelosporangium persicum]